MPWEIRKRDCGYAVVQTNTGRQVGCHPTKAMALAQQRALYANVDEAGTLTRLMRHKPFREAVDRRAGAIRAHRALVRVQPTLEAAFAATLRKLFAELGERVAAVYLAEERPLKEVDLPADAHNLVEHILTASSLREWAHDRLSPRFRDYWSRVLGATVKSLQASGHVTDQRGLAAERVLDLGGRRVGLLDMTGHTREALFRALEHGREEGLNPREIARLVRDFVPEGRFVNAGSAYRAQLIARTETLHAQRVSSVESYHTMKDVNHVVAFDGDSDEFCSSRNGEIFTLDDAAIENESDTVHPNCVLSWGPVAGGAI